VNASAVILRSFRRKLAWRAATKVAGIGFVACRATHGCTGEGFGTTILDSVGPHPQPCPKLGSAENKCEKLMGRVRAADGGGARIAPGSLQRISKSPRRWQSFLS
jgi:hypothetical protein